MKLKATIQPMISTNLFLLTEIRFKQHINGDVRKAKATKFFYTNSPIKSPVSRVSNKTKTITIFKDGIANVNIRVSDIEWNAKSSQNQQVIEEHIKSDLGRIVGGEYVFGRYSIIGDELEREWLNPNISNDISALPERPESFRQFFRPSNPKIKEKACLYIRYFTVSGFTLTTREHDEKYPLSKKKAPYPFRPQQEYATISVDYPAYFLELIVRFDKNVPFPPIDGIYLTATKKDIGDDLDQLYGLIPEIEEESNLYK